MSFPTRYFFLPLAGFAFFPAMLQAQSTQPTEKGQQVCLPETDPSSPRKSKLKGDQPSDEIIRLDLDNDADPDVLECWMNGKRVRFLDENDDMKPSDTRGDQSADSMQIDRDGDGYYDGPGDLNIKWVDDDGDGKPDAQLFAANPTLDQKTIKSGSSHWMAFIDTDHDGVNGYIDWTTFEFRYANWRTTGLGNYSADYNGDSVFLKQHLPPWAITDPRYNWENPFAFYDTDGDGCTEMAIRMLDTTKDTGSQAMPNQTYTGAINEAFNTFDLDNDSGKGNEFDFDMSIRFFSDEKNHGKRLDYNAYHDKHPGMKAPDWVIKAGFFRYDNWRKIDEFIYPTHDKAFDAMWNFADKWGSCWFVFDEDDDDHRWERVEFQYPTPSIYSTKRWRDYTSNDRDKAGLGGHPQADSLGDRGEWDADNSGHGQLYVGRFDAKIHLYGAESGAWLVDYTGKYWGAGPVVVGGSSKENAPKVEEVVQYKDTDNNGFFDLITYDYDGDGKVDLTVNLLDYKTDDNPHPDVVPLVNPGKAKWQGLHELYGKISRDSFLDGMKLYRAAWKKGLTDKELDDVLAFASSTGEQYDHGYWLKEKIFRKVDAMLSNDKDKQAALRKAYFLGDYAGVVKIIDGIDPAKK
jgi:hypothetical protein